MLDVQIKEITKDDNPQIESVIRSVFIELNLPLKGTAYEDPETSTMFEAYDTPKSSILWWILKVKFWAVLG